ncbi:MAG: hypothetical protein A2X86_20070 [Bdellovibrionales bacterium GWA2_49_15]|nr:MAG: hypothetical protein A2X86_20070 [Bdellovibrionales bacterium GWA2_49_15]HAZ11391.1 2-hydroxyhepta-2,4-diene-1,7-dioate isomerase [Bdellovibrionales bacterium]
MAIYCIGRNYVKHAHELGNEVPTSPLIFLKTENSLRGFAQSPLAFAEEVFHFEAELVLSIGQDLILGEEVTFKHIQGISLGIDLTRRQVQNELKAKGLPWTLSKSFVGSAILGKTYDFVSYSEQKNLTFRLKINGQERQRGDTQHMIFPFLTLCNYLNSFSTLKKGDLIYTGTPEGVGEIRRGDSFEMQLENETFEHGVL